MKIKNEEEKICLKKGKILFIKLDIVVEQFDSGPVINRTTPSSWLIPRESVEEFDIP